VNEDDTFQALRDPQYLADKRTEHEIDEYIRNVYLKRADVPEWKLRAVKKQAAAQPHMFAGFANTNAWIELVRRKYN
jgi:hypothetical protein